MSSNLMNTEPGGEQTQYEGAYTEVQPHKKSGGQFGNASTTTDPSQTEEALKARAERGEQTAENIRYGQTISEGGVSGFTTGQSGEATQEGYGGQVGNREQEDSAAASRKAAGYGGKEDMDREVGA